MSVCDNIREQGRRIEEACLRAGRTPDAVRLLAVSKTRDVGAIREAADCGQHEFAENYVNELTGKLAQAPDLSWHFIGRLQSNKVRQIVGRVAMIHTVDRPSLVREIDRRCAATDSDAQPVLIQVNVDGDEAKAGCSPENLSALVDECVVAPRVQLRGLMTIPAFNEDPEASRAPFRALWQLLEEQRARLAPAFADEAEIMSELSMGMSADLEIAVEEGATIVRIGTAIFGARD